MKRLRFGISGVASLPQILATRGLILGIRSRIQIR